MTATPPEAPPPQATAASGRALRRVARWRPHVAVVYGSGLWALPAGAHVEDQISYDVLAWPSGAVPGHQYRCGSQLCPSPPAVSESASRSPAGGLTGTRAGATRSAQTPVRALAAAGVSRCS